MRRQRQRGSLRPAPPRLECRKVCIEPIVCGLVSFADLFSSSDLTELDLPSTMVTHFANPADLLNFTLTITPDEGMFV